MSTVACLEPSSVFASAGTDLINSDVVKSESSKFFRCNTPITPKRRVQPHRAVKSSPISSPSPIKWKSPRRDIHDSPNSPSKGIEKALRENLTISKDPIKRSYAEPSRRKLSFDAISKWDPSDVTQINAVKEALHVSRALPTVLCREDEQKRILDFCKSRLGEKRAGSLYACGCPGTGKTLSIDKVKNVLNGWAKEAGISPHDELGINCTSLLQSTEIFEKILEKIQPGKKANCSVSPLKYLHDLYSVNKLSSKTNMLLLIVDEIDYLITKDLGVLHDLFMLSNLPFSKCILIGIANAIDLADRFLPRLRSLNCKPIVVTFRAYSHDQLLQILQQRLEAFSYTVVQQPALELCARKVAAASGDIRKALCVCRNAVEVLEAELKEFTNNANSISLKNGSIDPQIASSEEPNVVNVHHMAVALSRAFKSSIVENIRSFPQLYQFILCSTIKFFSVRKKDATIEELNRSYTDMCKSAKISVAGFGEFSNACMVLADQGLLKISQAKEIQFRKVALKVDESEIIFALQIYGAFIDFIPKF